MNICIVLGYLEVGGAEVQALRLAEYFQSCGCTVSIVGLDKPGMACELAAGLGLAVHSVPIKRHAYTHWSRLQNARKVWRAIRSARAEMVLPFTTEPNIYCGWVWRLSGAKGCVANHRDAGQWLREGRWQSVSAKMCSHWIANSHVGASSLTKVLGLPQSRISVIPNLIHLKAATRGSTLEASALPRTRPATGLMLGNLTPQKDHQTLLLGWRCLVDLCARRRVENAPRLYLAGRRDSQTAAIERQIKDLGLRDFVEVLGFVQDIETLLGSVDFVVHSSVSEGLPNGVLEPMSCGLPVLASDIPGCREALGDDPRVLFKCGNPDDLARKVFSVIHDPVLAAELGRINIARVRNEFGVASVGRKYFSLLESICKGQQE